LSSWPEPAVSDAQGRFCLRGAPADCALTLIAQGKGDTFAPQFLQVSADGAPEKEVTLALAPGRVLEGTVTYRDTGKPVPGAGLGVVAIREHGSGGFRTGERDAGADGKGRYRVVPYDASAFVVEARPPGDEPYLLNRRRVERSRGDVRKQEVNLSLRRGIRV